MKRNYTIKHKKYDTPYGKKTGLLLALSMNAYCREDKTVDLITDMIQLLKKHAPQDATHEGLMVCDLISKANNWLETRKQSIKNTEENYENS